MNVLVHSGGYIQLGEDLGVKCEHSLRGSVEVFTKFFQFILSNKYLTDTLLLIVSTEVLARISLIPLSVLIWINLSLLDESRYFSAEIVSCSTSSWSPCRG